MTPVHIVPETPSDRAVRCALLAGQRQLRLNRVRDALSDCTPADRSRILAALDGPVAS